MINELAWIKCCEVILPTSTGREIQLQCITQPDGYQRTLLQRLGRPKWRRMIETSKRRGYGTIASLNVQHEQLRCVLVSSATAQEDRLTIVSRTRSARPANKTVEKGLGS